MKITFEHYDKSFTLECSDETLLPDLVRDIGNLLKLVGYCFDGELDIINEEQTPDSQMSEHDIALDIEARDAEREAGDR